MYTKFYDNTITTKFVKGLISKANVPFISTWKPGDFAIRGMFYLTKDAIWKCQHTGWPQSIDDTCPETHIAHRSVVRNNQDAFKFFKYIKPYVFGEEYYNLVGSYESKILGYDTQTHIYLGQYLRMLRDIYDLDLMPFYNCFANEIVTDINFTSGGEVYFQSSNNNDYKIISVPVHFGKKYMIALDSDLPIEVMCVVYGTKGIIKELTDNLNSLNELGSLNNPDNPNHNTYRKYQKLQFQHPIIYKTLDWHQLYSPNQYNDDNENPIVSDEDYHILNDKAYDQRLGQFEKYLRLLIKLPKNNTSSIVVIEGDYSILKQSETNYTQNATWSNKYLTNNTVNSKRVTGEFIRPEIILNNLNNKDRLISHIKEDIETNNWEYKNIEPILLSPLGLLQINDGNTYAFSDRLIEYLLQNPITHLDEFSKNIERIQNYSRSNINYIKNGSKHESNFVPGVWDKDLQSYLFDLTKNSSLIDKKIDLTGYVDKDTESVISRGLKF